MATSGSDDNLYRAKGRGEGDQVEACDYSEGSWVEAVGGHGGDGLVVTGVHYERWSVHGGRMATSSVSGLLVEMDCRRIG
jgi:hypothetical protein